MVMVGRNTGDNVGIGETRIAVSNTPNAIFNPLSRTVATRRPAMIAIGMNVIKLNLQNHLWGIMGKVNNVNTTEEENIKAAEALLPNLNSR
jgi:hypothetical protein